MWFPPCHMFSPFVSGAAESTWSYWVKTLKKGNVTEGEMSFGSQFWVPSLPPPWICDHHHMWCCSISLELSRCMSYALRNDDCVLQRGAFCWLLLSAQTDFGFHLVTLWRTAWKWCHSQLLVPLMPELAAMVPLSHSPNVPQMGFSWFILFSPLSVEMNRHLLANTTNKPWTDVLILMLQEARVEELRCASTL